LKIEIDAVLRKPVSGGADRFVEGLDALEARLIDRMRAQAEASSLSPRFTFVRGLRLAG
jgi:hypothetical protein